MASLFLGELDDFIAPSQSCINPVFASTSNKAKIEGEAEKQKQGARITLSMVDETLDTGVNDEQKAPSLIQARTSGTDGTSKATVSLNDCLACSGCVTSAETVLLQQQSTDQFLQLLDSPQYRYSVVSLAPQSISALAQYLEMPFDQTQAALAAFLKVECGVHQVCSTQHFADFSLLETAAEFVWRLETQPAQGGTSAPWQKKPPQQQQHEAGPAPPREDRRRHLPLLISECPGWVCYAEKTCPEALPYIATARSPQQVAGSLFKALGAPACGLEPRHVLHATIMPCYDKKLEAARQDFLISGRLPVPGEAAAAAAEGPEVREGGGGAEEEEGAPLVPEVDLVLTTGELLGLLETRCAAAAAAPMEIEPEGGINSIKDVKNITVKTLAVYLAALVDKLLDCESTEAKGVGPLLPDLTGAPLAAGVPAHFGSGGYLEAAARAVLQGEGGEGGAAAAPLSYTQGRNPDFEETTIEVGGRALRLARAYGFRNIQTVVNRMKRGRSPYHLVEVMACPSGCLNGGGQPGAPTPGALVPTAAAAEAPAARQRRVEALRAAHEAALLPHRPPGRHPAVAALYRDHLGGVPFSAEARALLHTQYHAVPKLEASNPETAAW